MAILVVATPSLAGNAPSAAGCDAARSLLDRGELDKARDAYLDVLAADSSSRCAPRGLRAVTRGKRQEERLCAEGAVLAKADQREEAERRYVAALKENVASDCAKEGLAAKKSKGFWHHVGDGIA